MVMLNFSMRLKQSLARVLVLWGVMLLPFVAFGKRKMPDFFKGFSMIEKNCLLYRAYNDSIHGSMDDAEWLKLIERRAVCFQKMYAQNNRFIDEVTDYFRQDKKQVSEVAYDSLVVYIDRAFNVYDLDNFLVDHLTWLILPHYEEKQDTNTLVFLRHVAGVCNAEISRFQEKEAGQFAKKYYWANMQLADHYKQLSPKAARIIPLDFINYCYTLSALGYVSPSEALSATDQYEAFLEKYKNDMPENQMARCRSFLDKIRRTAARIHQESELKTAEDSIALKKMLDASPFSKMTASDLKNTEDSIYFYHYQYETKKMTAEEADMLVKRLTKELFDKVARQDTITEFDIQMVSNVFTLSISLMDANPLVLKQTRYLRVSSLCKQLVDMIQRTHIKRDPFFLESMLGQLACMKSIFKYLPRSEKANFMSELTVKSQIGTIVHVNTVNHLAVIMFEGMLKHCPEQFLGMMGLNTVEELRANQSALCEWIGRAAEYHDLGKIGISPIFNNDFRKLTEREFTLSRLHPELALRYLNVDSVFNSYKDVALGHHKWYNGKNGYPMSFDNTASPWRSCIDLVTICDCIDAATDNLGRNYRKNKTLQQVLEEFKRDAGTRYNPVMVKALVNDEELCKKLEYVVTNYRLEQLKEVRDRYMK